jgi:nucleoside-diphosphate-sugar epimerase
MTRREDERLLITGGSGFIGSRLALLAAASGYRVRVTGAARNAVERERIVALTAAGIPVIEATLEDRASLRGAVEGQHLIIHLGAAQHEAEAPESYFHRVNAEGTRSLITLAVDAGVRRFVYGSTIGVYGATGESSTLEEQSALLPDNPYGRSKVAAEQVVRSAIGIESCIARISETYGPHDMRLLKLFRAIARRRFVMIGSGANFHQPIYVDDVAKGLLACAVEPRAAGETILLAGSAPITTRQMCESIAAATARLGSLPRVPLWPFVLAARAFEATLTPLGMKPPLHSRRLDFFRKSYRFRIDKAQRLLGFIGSTSFEDGANLTAQWYRQDKLL